MFVQVSPQRWGPTSFLSHLPPGLLTSGLIWLPQFLSLHLHPARWIENNTSNWKWLINSTQSPLAEISSMVMANLGLVGPATAGKCDPTTEHSWWVSMTTILHSCFHNSFFFASPHTALSLSWPAGKDMDEAIREEMVQVVQIWRKQERKEARKV